MKKKREAEIDEDGNISQEQEQGMAEAFVNDDLINDFLNTYSVGNKYHFTHALSRAELRSMFGANIDFNTLDPLPEYLKELSRHGFREVIGLNHEPCIYVIEEDDFVDAEEIY